MPIRTTEIRYGHLFLLITRQTLQTLIHDPTLFPGHTHIFVHTQKLRNHSHRASLQTLSPVCFVTQVLSTLRLTVPCGRVSRWRCWLSIKPYFHGKCRTARRKKCHRVGRSPRARGGATDREIHDTVLIAAVFCMCNRYVDGLGARESGDLPRPGA